MLLLYLAFQETIQSWRRVIASRFFSTLHQISEAYQRFFFFVFKIKRKAKVNFSKRSHFGNILSRAIQRSLLSAAFVYSKCKRSS